MFGYVKPFTPDLRMREWEQYRGVYCTLCKRLGRRYGLLARMTLNYDFTFLAIFRMALSPDRPEFQKSRCSFLPTRRCLHCQNTAAVDEAADLAVLMLYEKCRDDRQDERFFRRMAAGIALGLLGRARKRAAAAQPAAAEAMAAYTQAQRQAERDGTSLDEAAQPTAALMQTLLQPFGRGDRTQERVLSRFGYCFGRWIYLADALDDWESDRAAGRFNPFALPETAGGDKAEICRRAEETLEASLAECCAAYELLDISHFDGILRNVLYEGMPHTQKRIAAIENKG